MVQCTVKTASLLPERVVCMCELKCADARIEILKKRKKLDLKYNNPLNSVPLLHDRCVGVDIPNHAVLHPFCGLHLS